VRQADSLVLPEAGKAEMTKVVVIGVLRANNVKNPLLKPLNVLLEILR